MKKLFLVVCILIILLSYFGLIVGHAEGRKPPEPLPTQAHGCDKSVGNPHCQDEEKDEPSNPKPPDPAPSDPEPVDKHQHEGKGKHYQLQPTIYRPPLLEDPAPVELIQESLLPECPAPVIQHHFIPTTGVVMATSVPPETSLVQLLAFGLIMIVVGAVGGVLTSTARRP